MEPLVIVAILVANGAPYCFLSVAYWPCQLSECTSSNICVLHAATVGVITETNAEKAIEELKAYEVLAPACLGE